MNYDHFYHAGSHADILKHVVLLAMMKELSKKPSAWCYLDTHAGEGIYDLRRAKAGHSLEFEKGIGALMQQTHTKLPPLLQSYFSILTQLNQEKAGDLSIYPGSTYWVKQCARSHDRLITCELKRSTYEALKKTFKGDSQIAVHHIDGYLGLKAFIPPKVKRGCVLIDPPYEKQNEWSQLIDSLVYALKHWQSGHYIIWYPLKNKAQVVAWLRQIKTKINNEILNAQLCPYNECDTFLYGSGVLIINPPWQFIDQLQASLAWLWNALSINRQGYFLLQ